MVQRNEMEVRKRVMGMLLPVNDVEARGTPQALRLDHYSSCIRYMNLL